MAEYRHLQVNFTAGELSPNIQARVDFKKYAQGAQEILNYIIQPQGGLTRRTGMKFMGETKFPDKKCRFVSFEFSSTQAYILEFGHLYMRVWKDRGRVVDPTDPSTPFEIITPYTEDQVQEFKFTQAADVLTIVHNAVAPHNVTRTGHDAWTAEPVVFTAAPAEWVEDDYPTCVVYFEQRLCFAATRGKPQTIWMSKSADFYNFTRTADVLDDESVVYTLAWDKVNEIQWLVSSRKLLIGTTGGEGWISGASDATGLTPSSVITRKETAYGSVDLPPLQVGEMILFVQRDRRVIRELAFDLSRDGYAANDVTLLAAHFFRNDPIVSWSFQQSPDSIVWITLESGKVVAMTYMREENVVGFTGQDIAGGVVESVATISGPSQTEVWGVVRREISGQTVRYAESFEPSFDGEDSTTAFFADSGLQYDGVPETVFTNLGHLEGETVQILADGAKVPDQTVVGGQVTLEKAASTASIGLGFVSVLHTVIPEISTDSGTAQGEKKNANRVSVRFLKTFGAQVGRPNEDLVDLDFEFFGGEYNTPPDLFSGDKYANVTGGYDTDGSVLVVQDNPFPCNILNVVTTLEVG